MSASAVRGFLVQGVVEGLVFTLLCCVLGTLVLRIAEERDRTGHPASALCRVGEVTGPSCPAVPDSAPR